MNMKLTKRDIELMYWINGLGFVEIDHITKKFRISKPTAYGRLRKLVGHNYLLHESVFYGKPGIYRVTPLAVTMLGDALKPLKRVEISTYHHNIMIAALDNVLVNKYGGEYIPERRLRHDIGLRERNTRGHVSDAVLETENKRIAIEVELSTKGKRRLDEIMGHYMKCFEYDEVWYFCGSRAIKKLLERVVEENGVCGFMKLFMINDFCS